MIEFKPDLLPPRFWAKVQIAMVGCWLWTGAKDRKGYGRVGLGTRTEGTISAHGWVCRVAHGEKPTLAHMVLHSCDTPACVNPAHLRWGTAAENSTDMIERGRTTRKVQCINMHALTDDNRYPSGGCKVCARERAAAKRRELKAA